LAPDWPLKQEFIANWKAVTNFFVEKKGWWIIFYNFILFLNLFCYRFGSDRALVALVFG